MLSRRAPRPPSPGRWDWPGPGGHRHLRTYRHRPSSRSHPQLQVQVGHIELQGQRKVVPPQVKGICIATGGSPPSCSQSQGNAGTDLRHTGNPGLRRPVIRSKIIASRIPTLLIVPRRMYDIRTSALRSPRNLSRHSLNTQTCPPSCPGSPAYPSAAAGESHKS
jgi:hypothetical protein